MMLNSKKIETRKVIDLRVKDTSGRTKQQNPGKRESVGKPVADSNDILNFGEAGERSPTGGLANASHVKGDSCVTIESQARNDSFEETLAATQNRIRVHQNDPQLPIRFCSSIWLEHPCTELHSVAAFDGERFQCVVL